jgi:hypothetical protein
MEEYCSVRVWQLKPGAMAADLEDLAATGIAEMHRWIPGIKQLSLVRVAHGPRGSQPSLPCYVMLTRFTNYEAYRAWRRTEEEGPDYWERYASIFMHWGQIADLIEEYCGDLRDLSDLSNLAPRQDSQDSV